MKQNKNEEDVSRKLAKVISLWKTKNHTKNTTPHRRSRRGGQEGNMLFGKRISNLVPNSVEDVTLTSQRLCEDYIDARLDRSGIKEYATQYPNAEEYFHVVRNMGLILEMKYPRLYNKVHRRLNVSLDSEIVVWDSFNKFGSYLFADNITWARIVAFFAFTGGLAVDVMRERKPDLVGRLIYWFSVFVMKKLSKWIRDQGGWKAIVDNFQPRGEENEDFEDEPRTFGYGIAEIIKDGGDRIAEIAMQRRKQCCLVLAASALISLLIFCLLIAWARFSRKN